MTQNTYLTILAAIGCFTAAIAFRKRPIILFAILLGSILAGPIDWIEFEGKGAPILLVDLYLLAWFVVAVIAPPTSRGMPYNVKVAVRALAAFLLVALASTAIFTPDLVKALYTFKNYAEGLLALYVVGTTIRTWRTLRSAFTCLYVFGAALAIQMAIVSSQGIISTLWDMLAADKNSAHTAFGQSNYLAGLIILVMPAALTAVGRSFKQTAIATACVLAMLMGLFVSASRGAILALAAGIVIALCYRPKRMALGLLITALCLTAAVSIVPEAFSSLLQERFYNLEYDRDTTARLLLWDTSWSVFLSHPVLGVGLKGSGYEYIANAGITIHTDAHDFLLTLLCETGLLGAYFYLAAMLACWRGGYRTFKALVTRTERMLILGLLLGVMTSTLHSLVEILHGSPEYSVLIWAILGILGASCELGPAERQACPPSLPYYRVARTENPAYARSQDETALAGCSTLQLTSTL